MRLVRIYHWLEKKFIFQRAEWISQTNTDRIQFFQRDFPDIDSTRLHELPNLPPQLWMETPNRAWKTQDGKLRLVYVGSLSCEDTFIRELVEWMDSDSAANCELDVYSYNHTSEVKQLFEANTNSRISFHEDGVAYEQLPEVLSEYHVGLILYRATTTNYMFNASNKLFEYLALGLDVWYPSQMLGVKPYARCDRAPRVVEVEFEQLASMTMPSMLERNRLPLCPSTDSCESALIPLQSTLLGTPPE